MDNGSVKSHIQLVSYKITKISLDVVQNIGMIAQAQHTNCGCEFEFSFRDASRFHKEDVDNYITGLRINLTVIDKHNKAKIATGEFIITGVFIASKGLGKTTEENLIKYQMPAILLPYLRATIMFVLSSSGFPSIVLPLINVNSLAHNAEIKIKEIEPPASAVSDEE